MFRLTREVRFAINDDPAETPSSKAVNGYAGYPPLIGSGRFFELRVTVEGAIQPDSGYLLNIKAIDGAIRRLVVPALGAHLRNRTYGGGAAAFRELFKLLRDAWPGARLTKLELAPTPFFCLSILAWEFPMVRVSQKFEFSATHRLHNPALGDEENELLFGKCNNPHGHGHNYELQVTVVGEGDTDGSVVNIPRLEELVVATVIDRFDHRNLNIELAEFREQNPTVENIARVIYRLLDPKLKGAGITLAGVTVWETPKTFCEYTEREESDRR
jgi:6-pyruvoyltetrahydropterin/6-carboxytetrahydropterin synthase